jgi:fatty-acyl-CoA synthase
MRGYYSQPELTAQTLDAQGWLHTGDLGMMTPQGHLRFIGRLKDILRVGGENVAPAEIEEALLKHPSVANAQVIGVPDARLSEVPAAYVTLKQSGAITGQDLIAWMQSRIANFKVPRHIAIVDNFENLGMTASGKVQKTKLREDAVKRFAKP